MSKRNFLVFLAIFFFSSCKKESSKLDGRISGTVRDAQSEEPIAFANVYFEVLEYDGWDTYYTAIDSTQADAFGRFDYERSEIYDYANARKDGYFVSSATSVSIAKSDLCRFSIYLKPKANLRLIVRDNPDLNEFTSVEYNVPGNNGINRERHYAGDDNKIWETEVYGGRNHPLYLYWDVETETEQGEIWQIFTPSHTLTEFILEY